MNSSLRIFTPLALMAAIALPSLVHCQSIRYVVTEMPTFGDYAGSGAYSLNRDGSVVGYAYTGSGAMDLVSTAQAFVWKPIANNSPLGTQMPLQQSSGGTFSVASSISNNSRVAGYLINSSGQRYMASWNADSGVATPLVSIPSFVGNSLCVNDAGQIAYTNDGTPFVYQGGASSPLNCSFGGAYSINQQGDVAGSGNTGLLGSYQGIVWQAGAYGTPNNVGLVIGDGFRDAGALFALNSQRRATGYVQEGTITRAYYWDFGVEAPTFILPSGVYSSGFGINEQGDVVGSYRNSAGQFGKPFLYENGNFHDLQSEIDPLNGWYLTDAFDVNEYGQICGFGYLNGRPRGYLLTPIHLNQPPVAIDDSYGVNQGGSLSVAPSGILVNDTDTDNDPLSVSLASGPSHASAFQLNADGSFTYTPQPYFYGEDTFTYLANDGTADSGIATVHITVQRPGAGGFITGGGKLLSGGKRTFGFVAKVVGTGTQGNLEFQDHDAGLNVKSSSVDWVYAPNQIDGYFSGSCSVNGASGFTFFVQIHDRGEPGRDDDFTVWVFDSSNELTYSSGGQLAAGGNIVIHGT